MIEKATRTVQKTVEAVEQCLRCTECGRKFDDTRLGQAEADNHHASEHVVKVQNEGFIWVTEEMLLDRHRSYQRKISIDDYPYRISWTGPGWYFLIEGNEAIEDRYVKIDDIIDDCKDKIRSYADGLRHYRAQKRRLGDKP